MPEFDYDFGSIIEYYAFGGTLRRVKVDYREDDIKNGRPGFVGTIVGSDDSGEGDVWGYDSQIVRVVSR